MKMVDKSERKVDNIIAREKATIKVDKTKRKAEKQRLKIMKAYYKLYAIGDTIFDDNKVKYSVLGKYRLDNEYYFVVQDINGILQLQKVVYGNRVRTVNVSREGKQYSKNSDVFDTWFAEAEKKRTVWLERYYDKIPIGEKCKDINYILVSKKKYAGNYYFILKDYKCQYVVARLGWWYTKVRVEILSDNELAKNKSMFNSWINTAKLLKLMGG